MKMLKMVELCTKFDEASARYENEGLSEGRLKWVADLAAAKEAVREELDAAMKDLEGHDAHPLERHLVSLASMTYYCAWRSRRAGIR